jgi:RimJ/RimL family protein N-acetyltransferase
VTLRSLEERELATVHRQQNGGCRYEISELLDHDTPWAPMSLDQVREKVANVRGKDRTALVALWAESDECIGLGWSSAEWDPWAPGIHVVIWPEYRRKGYGTEAARLLLDLGFAESPAHSMTAYVPDWCAEGLAFAESLGFRRSGAMRRVGRREGRFFDGEFFDLLRDEYLGPSGDGP